MHGLRACLLGHRRIAILIVALALAMKALLPAGYMISSGPHSLAITICGGVDGKDSTARIEVPAKGGAQGDAERGKASEHCPYSGLSMAALGGADAVLLATALAFILLLGFLPVRVPLARQRAHLRPPLRGPPATA